MALNLLMEAARSAICFLCKGSRAVLSGEAKLRRVAWMDFF